MTTSHPSWAALAVAFVALTAAACVGPTESTPTGGGGGLSVDVEDASLVGTLDTAKAETSAEVSNDTAHEGITDGTTADSDTAAPETVGADTAVSETSADAGQKDADAKADAADGGADGTADAAQDSAASGDTAETGDDAADAPTCVPTSKVELCNNKDDDCDGQTDEKEPGLCNDKDPCSIDNCAGGKCVNLVIPGLCDDGNICTEDDQCVNGQCLPGDGKPCTDSNPCTDNGCDQATGCVFTPVGNGGACEDGNPCTQGDVCTAGTCKPGLAKTCDDKDPCTDDSCGTSGCIFGPNNALCSDGNECTVGDKCGGGACKPGTGKTCDDANACTNDTCTVAGGCQHSNNTAACSDNSACTDPDLCSAGVCKAGAAKVCSDGDPCTTDSCNPATGCIFAVGPNGVVCPGGTCSAGKCLASKVCGNGVIEAGETCDDGDATSCGTCNATCSGPGTGTAMSGSYAIGGVGAQFATFGDAVAALAKCGIKGATTFNVAAGSYKQATGFDFPLVTGASAVNTVTFKAAAGAVVKLVGTTGTGSYGGVVRIANNASYLTIDGFDIDGTLPENKIGSSYSGPVVFNSGGGQSHIQLRNLRIHDFGPTAWATTSYIGGIYIQQSVTVADLTIEGCRFENLAPSAPFHTQGAISTRNGKFTNLRILGNRFSGIKGMDPINLRNGAGFENLLIANNFIVSEAEGAVEFYGTAVFVNAGQFVHNTVVLTGTAVRGIGGALTGPALDVRNNIVFSTTNTLPFVTGTTVNPVGFNCLGTKITPGYAAMPTDIKADAKFATATAPNWDLHLLAGSPCLDAGAPISTVTTDIDHQPRGAKPDLGADELP